MTNQKIHLLALGFVVAMLGWVPSGIAQQLLKAESVIHKEDGLPYKIYIVGKKNQRVYPFVNFFIPGESYAFSNLCIRMPYQQLYQTRFKGINMATYERLTKAEDCGSCGCESTSCDSIRGRFGGCRGSDGKPQYCFVVDSPDPIYDHIRGKPLQLPILHDPGMCRGDEDERLDSLLKSPGKRCYELFQYINPKPEDLRSWGMRVPEVDLALSKPGHSVPAAFFILNFVYGSLYPALEESVYKRWVVMIRYRNQKVPEYLGAQIVYSPHPFYTELAKREHCYGAIFGKPDPKNKDSLIPTINIRGNSRLYWLFCDDHSFVISVMGFPPDLY